VWRHDGTNPLAIHCLGSCVTRRPVVHVDHCLATALIPKEIRFHLDFCTAKDFSIDTAG
jgi:hypothetical protein